jgi:hypothetical protein
MTEVHLIELQQEAGRLRDADRVAAAAAALPLLATYVADAPTWGLSPTTQVETHGETEQLGSFVEMRVALAAARRLERVLRSILDRPSFQYSRSAEESVGTIRGQLDVQRYVRERGVPQPPRRYPVRVLRRRHVTAENVLASYAAHWILRALRRAPLNLLPPNAPERRELMERRSSISALMRHAALAETLTEASGVFRRGQFARLVDEVKRRLESGRVASADRYWDLIAWAEDFSPDAGPKAGAVEWLFYDARFDPKLFEIWVLGLLLTELTERVGPPTAGPRPLYERTHHPITMWRLGAVTLGLHFQASLARLGGEKPRWRYAKPVEAPFRGFPDIALTIERVDGSRRVVIVDPKLRERVGAPVEEIYKLLGYFQNLNVAMEPAGSIVFYGPGNPRTYELQSDAGGRALAIAADPSDGPGSAEQVKAIVDLVFELSNVSEEAITALAAARAQGDSADIEEATSAVVQQQAVDAMVTSAQALPAGTLEPFRKATAAQLHDVWDRLSPSVQTMLVTAEYFGINAPAEADHSGPLLGLAAACESLLYEGLFDFLCEKLPGLFPTTLTFGTLIYHLNDAARQQPRSDEGKAIAMAIRGLDNVDGPVLRGLISDLRDLNVRYRIPAAHRDLVSQEVWVGGRSHVFEPPHGVLPRLIRALFGVG